MTKGEKRILIGLVFLSVLFFSVFVINTENKKQVYKMRTDLEIIRKEQKVLRDEIEIYKLQKVESLKNEQGDSREK